MTRVHLFLLAATAQALLAPHRPLPRPTALRLAADAAPAASKPSLVARFNNFGLSLKDRSRRQREALKGAGLMKLPRGVYVAALSLAFVAYRAYRGFFVVLPAVYGEVYAQALAQATEEHVSIRGVEVADDIDPKTGKLRLRSRVVMNVGALAWDSSAQVGECNSSLFLFFACASQDLGHSRVPQEELFSF